MSLGSYHHINFIQATKSDVLTTLMYNICHNGLLYLQKIVLQSFSANSEGLAKE